MCQLASVRTLLQMRISLPVRPSASCVPCGSRILVADRPFTAPCLPSGNTKRTEEDYEVEDPDEILATAADMLHNLQHTWLRERQAEIDQFWCQLEQQTGRRMPRDVEAPSSVLGCLAPCQDGTLEVCEEDESPLEEVRELCHRIEARRAEESKLDTVSELKNESALMEALRLDVTRLKVSKLPASVEFGTGTHPGNLELVLASEMTALSQWIAGLQNVVSSDFVANPWTSCSNGEGSQSDEVSEQTVTQIEIEKQLDEILSDFTEIDRIHDAVRAMVLTHA